jgi:hypothetical protein
MRFSAHGLAASEVRTLRRTTLTRTRRCGWFRRTGIRGTVTISVSGTARGPESESRQCVPLPAAAARHSVAARAGWGVPACRWQRPMAPRARTARSTRPRPGRGRPVGPFLPLSKLQQ